MHTASVTDSVRIGVKVSVRRVLHGLPYAHTTSLFALMRKCGMRKINCGMQSAECTCEMVCRMRMRKACNQGVFMLSYCNKVMTTTIMMNLC